MTVNPGAGQAVTALEYDAAGQVTKVTAPDGSFLQYAWNNAKRLTSVTNNTGEKIEYGYNANGDVTATTIRSAANAIVMQQSALFDELGRLMRQIGASAQTMIYGYDCTDNLKTVTDPRSNLYRYAYDALSRLIRETSQEGGQVNYGNGLALATAHDLDYRLASLRMSAATKLFSYAANSNRIAAAKRLQIRPFSLR